MQNRQAGFKGFTSRNFAFFFPLICFPDCLCWSTISSPWTSRISFFKWAFIPPHLLPLTHLHFNRISKGLCSWSRGLACSHTFGILFHYLFHQAAFPSSSSPQSPNQHCSICSCILLLWIKGVLTVRSGCVVILSCVGRGEITTLFFFLFLWRMERWKLSVLDANKNGTCMFHM